MQTLVAGHKYTLDNFEKTANAGENVIQFIQKEPPTSDSTELVTVKDGTTNEEVLAMLIDRMQYLQSKHPCRENAIVLTNLEESLMWLNKRTADRKARGVEGTNAK